MTFYYQCGRCATKYRISPLQKAGLDRTKTQVSCPRCESMLHSKISQADYEGRTPGKLKTLEE